MIRGLLITSVVSFIVAVAALAGAAALGGPEWGRGFLSGFGDDVVITHGPDIERAYDWTGGDTLTINAPAEVVYTQGPASRVTIAGPQALLDRVTFANGEIDLDGRVNGRNGLKIKVEAPAVTGFRFNGGQDVEIRNYAQDRLAIEVNGAAEVDAKGSARFIDLRTNGASDVDLDDVVNDEARVELNGASSASLAPKTSVDIRINGVGNVSLKSKPLRMKKEIHGVGGVSYGTEEDHGDGGATAPVAPKATPTRPAAGMST